MSEVAGRELRVLGLHLARALLCLLWLIAVFGTDKPETLLYGTFSGLVGSITAQYHQERREPATVGRRLLGKRSKGFGAVALAGIALYLGMSALSDGRTLQGAVAVGLALGTTVWAVTQLRRATEAAAG